MSAVFLLTAISISTLHRTLAQEFVPLSNYSDYGLLQDCQQLCLETAPVSGQHDTIADSKDSCGSLILELDRLSTCVDSRCGGNKTAVYKAQSILAEYCTSVGTVFTATVPTTMVLAPSTGENAGHFGCRFPPDS